MRTTGTIHGCRAARAHLGPRRLRWKMLKLTQRYMSRSSSSIRPSRHSAALLAWRCGSASADDLHIAITFLSVVMHIIAHRLWIMACWGGSDGAAE